MTTRYIALVDGGADAYGVAFPDARGRTAMGAILDAALVNAVRSDADVAEQLTDGAALAVVPLIMESGTAVRANLSLDAGLLAAIDDAASAAGLTRSAFLASAARDKILAGI